MKKIIFVLLIFALAACSSQKEEKETEKNNKENGVKELLKLDDNQMLVATLKTNMGTVEIELFAKQTPKTVENFVGLTEKDYYKGVTFHRVIPEFMIQGGDPTGSGSGGESLWGKDFEDEIISDLKHDSPGILSMANRGPNTNSSQFFITLVPTPWLDGKHTIFGKVIKGMEVVEAIGNVETKPPFDKPSKDVVIEEVKIEKKAK